MSDIEAIRARHNDCTVRTCLYYPEFYDAHLDTPCDTAVVLAALDEYERDSWYTEWRKARADADRLLDIARQVVHYADLTAETVRAGEDLQSVMVAWRETVDYCREALRRHGEATR